MPLHPRTCSGLYSISCLLDALDGYAARYFEQSTKFGAVLDMVTDRCTTACLLVFLASAWPRWAIVFQGLISLDLASHYVHMYATLSMGGSGQSHKQVDKSRSWLLNQYYTNKVRRPMHTAPKILTCYRLCSLSAVYSTRSSLSPYTSYLSLRPTYRHLSCKLQTRMELRAPSSLEPPRDRPHLSCSTHTVLVHWSWREPTRWIRSCRGLLRA